MAGAIRLRVGQVIASSAGWVMRKVLVAGAVLVAAGAVLMPDTAAQEERQRTQRHADARPATATLKDARGRTVGTVTLRETSAGVLLRADFSNVPEGPHGFHLHETGKCEAPSFESAGGHYNPDGRKHGFFPAEGPHAGDMPNVHVPSSGRLAVEVLNTRVTLAEGRGSLFDGDGTAILLHSAGDDYRTDPAGEAGDRIACGVIERASDQ